jgi:hypothetical protein
VKPTQELFTLDDVLTFDIEQRMELRDFYRESQGRTAKLPSAEEEKALDARIAKVLKDTDRLIQAMKDVDAPPEDWRAQRKKQATDIRCEIATRAAELKQCGVRTPIAQAREEVAKRYGRASGLALKKWLVRNR